MAGFSFSRPVSFSDCDPAGVAHFSKVACWVEEAEHAYLKQAGFPIQLQEPDAWYWPRVQFAAEYLGPIRYGETALVDLKAEPGSRSILWTWSVRTEEHPVANGTMKTVCCRMEVGKLVPQEIPVTLKEGVTSDE